MKDTTARFLEVLQHVAQKTSVYDSSVITRSKISHLNADRNDVSIEMIVELCRIDPLVNAEYIINGRGPVFFRDFRQSSPEDTETAAKRKPLSPAVIQELEMKLALLDRSIDRVLKDIAPLVE